MTEYETRKAAKECIQKCFEKDTEVMIDESIMRIRSVMFYVYDLIYFGNKIIISKHTLNKIKSYRNQEGTMSTNAKYLLENMERDEYENYQIVDISKEKGHTSAKKLANYLAKNKQIVYLLESKYYYEKLKEFGVEKQLKLIDVKTKISSFAKDRNVEFATIGAIQHENGKMFLINRPGDTIFKVYDDSGKEKKGETIEVEVNDIVLVRSDKKKKYSFNLCKVITHHTRHQAIHIIWTDIVKGCGTNFYVERLEDKYRRIILENL